MEAWYVASKVFVGRKTWDGMEADAHSNSFFFCTKEMCMSRMVVVWALLLIIFIQRPLGACML